MILIADSGSTKTEWLLAHEGREVVRVETKGMNPFFRTSNDMAEEVHSGVLPALAGRRVEAVRFFGAGCASPERNAVVEAALAVCLPEADIRVGSDLLGAAVAVCGDRPGIACILGTGSNSCFYDGQRIVQNVSPLGFILGDEGSGAVLGRLFIGACLKGQYSPALREALLDFLGMTPAGILDRVYRQPLPNRFLASVMPFIRSHTHEEAVYTLVHDAFCDFFRRNVMQYDYRTHAASFVGSVAFHFEDILRRAAATCGVQAGDVVQSPMQGLVAALGR